jgi:RimJ/RimL family protein N-acetyltransferase
MLFGTHAILRAIEPGDLEQLRLWRNDPQLRRNFREYREISPADQQRWYDSIRVDNLTTRMFAITDSGGTLLGACGLCYIDWMRRSADFSIYLGRGYLDDKYALCAARMLMRYAFEDLGLHRLWAEVYEFDELKAHFLTSIGFRFDGALRDAHYAEGKWWDSRMFSSINDRDLPPRSPKGEC